MPAEPKNSNVVDRSGGSSSATAAGTSSNAGGSSGTAASKKRSLAPKRGAIACVRCKERKAKCVPAPPGTSPVPTCTNCLTAKKECIYLERTPNEIFLLEYVSQLEARCAALEVELRKSNPASGYATDHIQMPAEARSAAVNKLNQVYAPAIINPAGTSNATGTAPIPIKPISKSNDDGNNLEVRAEEGPSSVPSTGSAAPELTVDGEEDEQDLALGIGMLSLGGGEEPVYVGPSSGINWARVCATALRRPREATQPKSHLSRFSYLAPPELASVQSALEYTLHHPTPPLPPPRLASHYLDLVYEHIQARYGCFDWIVVKNWHENREAICQGRPLWGVGTGADERRNLASFFLWLCYGYGARLSEDEKLEGAVSHEVYYNAAVACLSTLTSHHSLATVQALVLLIIYGLRHPTAEVSVWQVGGLAMRTAVELGMHRRLRSRSEREKDPMRYEMKKRVFWAVYTLDRMMAAQLGRPAGIQDRDIDVELPLNVDVDFSDAKALYAMQNIQIEMMAGRRPGDEYTNGYGPVSSMTSAIHNIRMNQLKQMITDAIYRLDKPLRPRDPDARTGQLERQSYDEADDLLARLDQWRACQPQPQEGVPMLPVETWELEYHNCVQLLLRPIVASCKAAGRYVTLCLESAAALCETQYNYLQPPIVQSKLSTWRFYRLFLAGLTLLHIITTFHPYLTDAYKARAESAIRKCQTALGVFGSKFKAAGRHEGLFKELVTAWENGLGSTVGRKNDGDGNDSGSSPGPGPGLAGIGIEGTAEDMIARLFDIQPTPPADPLIVNQQNINVNAAPFIANPDRNIGQRTNPLIPPIQDSSLLGYGQQPIPINQPNPVLSTQHNPLTSPANNNGLSLSLESINGGNGQHFPQHPGQAYPNGLFPIQTGGLQSTDDWASMLGEMGGGAKDDFFSLMSSFGLETATPTPFLQNETADPIFDFLTSPQPATANPASSSHTVAESSGSNQHPHPNHHHHHSQPHHTHTIFPGSGNIGNVWDGGRRDSNLGMSDWAGLFDHFSANQGHPHFPPHSHPQQHHQSHESNHDHNRHQQHHHNHNLNEHGHSHPHSQGQDQGGNWSGQGLC
ncbi:uncharacterized protein L201_005559 [Kwoniella dendrophila CBS 6074]|uniref:Zn(2)-C6 fungal-type domain-containing protein n=1 Tax=Kwoniella dendrophila CBS 6074 TaxID=1295534 RepID=A0AAX4K0I1_9TREE